MSFGANNRSSCLAFADSFFANCRNFVAVYLTKNFFRPLQNMRAAYKSIYRLCTERNTSDSECFTNCTRLELALRHPVLAIAGDATLLMRPLQDLLCTNSPATAVQATALFPVLKLLFKDLNTAVPLQSILNKTQQSELCLDGWRNVTTPPGVFTFEESLRLLGLNLPALQRILGQAEQVLLPENRALLWTVQSVIPQRINASIKALLSTKSAPQLIGKVDIQYVFASMSFQLCAATFPMHSGEQIPLCPWLCHNLSLSIDNARSFFSLPRNATLDPAFSILSWILSTCVSRGQWTRCLDRSCNNETHICFNGTKTAKRARRLGQGFCLSRTCPRPLKQTTDPRHWQTELKATADKAFEVTASLFPNLGLVNNRSVLPCGYECRTITFDLDDERVGRIVTGSTCWLLFVINVVAFITFFFHLDKLNKYPTNILPYFHLSTAMTTLGVNFQYFVDRKAIICHSDGTLRVNEPLSGSDSSLACTLLFTWLLYWMMATLSWWLPVVHGWYTVFTHLETKVTASEHYVLYYHLFAWLFPLIPVSIALGKHYIGGFPLYGICFLTETDGWLYCFTLPMIVVGASAFPMMFIGARKLMAARKNLHDFHNNTVTTIKQTRSSTIYTITQKRSTTSVMSERANKSSNLLHSLMTKMTAMILLSYINTQVRHVWFGIVFFGRTCACCVCMCISCV